MLSADNAVYNYSMCATMADRSGKVTQDFPERVKTNLADVSLPPGLPVTRNHNWVRNEPSRSQKPLPPFTWRTTAVCLVLCRTGGIPLHGRARFPRHKRTRGQGRCQGALKQTTQRPRARSSDTKWVRDHIRWTPNYKMMCGCFVRT